MLCDMKDYNQLWCMHLFWICAVERRGSGIDAAQWLVIAPLVGTLQTTSVSVVIMELKLSAIAARFIVVFRQ